MDITKEMTNGGAVLILAQGSAPNTTYQVYKVDKGTYGELNPERGHSQPQDVCDTSNREDVLTAVSGILDTFGDS